MSTPSLASDQSVGAASADAIRAELIGSDVCTEFALLPPKWGTPFALGWSVIPLRAGGKEPLIKWEEYQGRRPSLDEIADWARRWPGCNVGIVTGEISGLVVLDLDTAEAIAEAERRGLPATASVRTGRGGKHFYFEHPGVKVTSRSAWCAVKGLDTKGDGGYVVAAGSRHPNGNPYEWIMPPGLGLAPMPQWLQELACVDPTPLAGKAKRALNIGTLDIEAALAAIRAGNGWHDHTLRLVASFVARGFSDEEILAFADKITLPGWTVDDTRRDLKRMIEGARRKGFAPIELLSQGGTPQQPATPIKATPFSWPDPATLPPREWLYGRHLIRGFLSCTVAPGGVGKSSLVIADALAMVSGRNLVGHKPARPLNVWVWNGEDPRHELLRRAAAAARHYGLTGRDCPGTLYLDSGWDVPLLLAQQGRDGAIIAEPVYDALAQEIRERKIDVLVVDPFVTCHRVAENDNGAIDAVAKTWARLAHENRCAVELVHHTRKNGGQETKAEDARGASALLAAARSARVLNVMSKEEAREAGIDPISRGFHFYAVNGKSNLAPPSDAKTWYRLLSVDLGNGGIGPGDSVGVVTPWQWPDALAGVTAADLYRVQQEIHGKDYPASVQAKGWVGHAIGKVLGIDTSNEAGAARVKILLRAWLATGALVEEQGDDPRNGRKRPVVRVGKWADA
ncbi:MAG: AAA family ATPase [Variibacter sp.]|nr:AAA family ATPase [Variibacter sp.]